MKVETQALLLSYIACSNVFSFFLYKRLKLKKIQILEEKISLIQNEMSNMSDEIYNQQKEIEELKSQIKTLKLDIKNMQNNNTYDSNTFNDIPPHY